MQSANGFMASLKVVLIRLTSSWKMRKVTSLVLYAKEEPLNDFFWTIACCVPDKLEPDIYAPGAEEIRPKMWDGGTTNAELRAIWRRPSNLPSPRHSRREVQLHRFQATAALRGQGIIGVFRIRIPNFPVTDKLHKHVTLISNYLIK